jgi:serine/threonine protein phosphatase PrpC
MGCTSSTPTLVAQDATKESSCGEKSKSHQEINLTEPLGLSNHYHFNPHAAKNLIAKVGDLSIRYACFSQRGRDPDHPQKPNQDCFGHHWNNSAAYFAVYDGHGPTGEQCSDFVKKKLPSILKRHIEEKGGVDWVTTDDIHKALHDAHVECNEQLHASEIDDSLSGTTSVGLYVHGGCITACNVGDSRVILGTMSKNDEIRALPLSKDHTPYRLDEVTRCKAAGARILSMGQIDPSTIEEGDENVEDPPRVWAPDGSYPGTAFTRSLGDSVAERLGVNAEPELLTLVVSPTERLIVIASDGVFDVVSNQEVVDLCFRHRSDPATACIELINKSHKEWLLNDDCDEDKANYDDMTCICIFFDHAEHKDESIGGPPLASTQEKQQRQGKRVRQKTLQNLDEMKVT